MPLFICGVFCFFLSTLSSLIKIKNSCLFCLV
ncbi:putative signal peptide protein [Puccinia sorghi]|uniref:Putative signal peptide protein n=1 Tax=Puccinia sorghi TaxID=27349 RepID=A0A0L6UD62_9BASI|nr:putative signal peptide protein [Puccinia sorghi]